MDPFSSNIQFTDDLDQYKVRMIYMGTNNLTIKEHYIKDGENLSSIAYKYYGDSGRWGIIADFNLIFDPFDIRENLNFTIHSGRKLLIPLDNG